MANHEYHVQSKVHVETLYGGAHVGMLHRVQRARVSRYAEPEPAKGVQGEPSAGQCDLFRAGKQDHEQLQQRRRSGGPGAGGRHDHMEDDRAE